MALTEAPWITEIGDIKKKWLTMDGWTRKQAERLLCGVDPDTHEQAVLRPGDFNRMNLASSLLTTAYGSGRFARHDGAPADDNDYVNPEQFVIWWVDEQGQELPAELAPILARARRGGALGVITDPSNPYYSEELLLAVQCQAMLPELLDKVPRGKQRKVIAGHLEELVRGDPETGRCVDRLATILNPTRNK